MVGVDAKRKILLNITANVKLLRKTTKVAFLNGREVTHVVGVCFVSKFELH